MGIEAFGRVVREHPWLTCAAVGSVLLGTACKQGGGAPDGGGSGSGPLSIMIYKGEILYSTATDKGPDTPCGKAVSYSGLLPVQRQRPQNNPLAYGVRPAGVPKGTDDCIGANTIWVSAANHNPVIAEAPTHPPTIVHDGLAQSVVPLAQFIW